jgi:hypothetical protein
VGLRGDQPAVAVKHHPQYGGWGVDGEVGPRTGAVERVVLTHCSGTRRVAFGVGNAWSLFPA